MRYSKAKLLNEEKKLVIVLSGTFSYKFIPGIHIVRENAYFIAQVKKK